RALERVNAREAEVKVQLRKLTPNLNAAAQLKELDQRLKAHTAQIGFPSVGKSTFLSTVTETASACASYEFTTLTCVPGVLEMHGARIQVLDLPGIIEGAASGKGRGRQVIATARTSDLILMMLSAANADVERRKLIKELSEMGIRVNQQPPDVVITPKSRGGIQITSTCQLTHIDEDDIKKIIGHEFKTHNAEVVIRQDITVDQLIDVLVGNRVYMPCLYVVNKIDTLSFEALEHFALEPRTVVTSIKDGINIEYVKEMIWRSLGLVRVYTKPRGEPPCLDAKAAMFFPKGSTVEDVCKGIHKDFVSKFKGAKVWGRSVKFQPQNAGLSHVLADNDVVQILLD
ncbi:hypothetical protein KIPB_007848, partial [Kipferlia bialata]